ncbi:hypothetical protein MBLNU13_g09884t2 [Cladosporium sp. NU13]
MSDSSEYEEDQIHDELVQELKLACDEDDIPRIAHLLTTTSLDSADATNVVTKKHSIRTLQCLLEHGADTNRIQSRIRLPSLDVLKLLTRFGYDVKANGHLILQDYADSREILDWILDHGVDINDSDPARTDAFGRQAPLAVGFKDYSVKVLNNVAQLGDVELFAHLVNRGADPRRSLALHAVAMCRDPEKAKAMIDRLIDVHHMDLEGDNKTLTLCLIYYSEALILRELLDRALGLAVDNKDIEAARICLAHSADVSVVIEEQRAKTVRQQARREKKAKGTWGDGDGYHDSHPSEDDEDDADVRTKMEEFLCSVERTKRGTSEE